MRRYAQNGNARVSLARLVLSLTLWCDNLLIRMCTPQFKYGASSGRG
jgi:hypothetical protein